MKKFSIYTILIALMTHPIYGADKINQFFSSANSFIIKSIGPGVVLLGILIAGIFIALGRPEGVRRGVYAIMGGLMITASSWLYNLITRWAS